MKRKFRWIITLLFFLVLGFLFTLESEVIAKNELNKKVSADDVKAIPYYIKIDPSDEQVDKQLTYYDLLVKPGSRQALNMTLHNTSKKKIKVSITPNTAKTSENGNIDYSGITTKSSKTVKYSFKKLCSSKQIVELNPMASKKVTFYVDIPKKGFSGVVLGGFYVKEVNQKGSSQKVMNGGSQISIKNEYASIKGVKLRTNLDEEINPNFKVYKANIVKWNNQVAVKADIANESPMIMSNFIYRTKIIKEDDKTKIFETSPTNFSMAPESVFSLTLPLNKVELAAGKYNYLVTIQTADKQNTWKLNKKFTVTNQNLKTVKKQIAEDQPDSKQKNYKWIIGIILLSLLAILIVFRWKRGKTHEKG